MKRMLALILSIFVAAVNISVYAEETAVSVRQETTEELVEDTFPKNEAGYGETSHDLHGEEKNDAEEAELFADNESDDQGLDESEKLPLPVGDWESDEEALTNGIVRPAALSVQELRNKFPNGKYWNHPQELGTNKGNKFVDSVTDTPCPTHNGYCGTAKQSCNGYTPPGKSTEYCWQCQGFAYKLGYDSTGIDPFTWTLKTNASAMDSVKPGDIVHYYTNKATNSQHVVFVIGVSGDTLTIAECNYDNHCRIRWDSTKSISNIKNSFKGLRVNPSTLQYGNDVCNCSSDYAGTYRVTTNSSPLTIRSGHGTSYAKIGEIPKGETCSVSKGDSTWAHVEYNGITGYCSMQYLSKVENQTLTEDERYRAAFDYRYQGNRLYCYLSVDGTQKGYIDPGDNCTVNNVYTNGWINVTFPTSSGSLTRYAKLDEFLGGTTNPVDMTAAQKADTFYDSGRQSKRGWIDPGDFVTKLREENGSTLVLYPGDQGVIKCAWASTSELAVRKDISNASILLSPDTFTYNGGEHRPNVTVNYGGVDLSASDYDVTYSNNVNAGTATVTVNGKGIYVGSKSANFRINPAPLGGIELGQTSYEFTGYPATPEPLVKDASGNVLRKDIDYAVTYEHYNQIGTAKVTAYGIGNYAGSVSANYSICGLDLGNDFWAVIRSSLTDHPGRKYVSVAGDGRVVVDSSRDDNTDCRLWHFVKKGDGSYNLYTSSNSFSGKVMDAVGYNDTDGADVIVNVFIPDSTAEGWDIYRNDDGYALSPRFTERVLDVTNGNTDDGNRMCITTINHTSAQKFYIQKLKHSSEQTIPDGVYSILSAENQGFALTIDCDSNNDGANVHLWTHHRWNRYMMWEFKYVENGYYHITNLDSGKNLDVDGAEIGANVHQWTPDSGSRRQRWQVIPFNGNYALIPECAQQAALDIGGGVNADGTNIGIWEQHDGFPQQFVLHPCRAIDVNGMLDGNAINGLSDYGTVSVYIDEHRVSDENVNDFWGIYPIGSTYEITNVKPSQGKMFVGYNQGSPIGNIVENNLDLRLDFRTIDTSNIGNPYRTDYYGGNTYMYFNSPVTWYEANEFCKKLGGHLVTITSHEENEFIKNLTDDANHVWMGATDKEGSWQWVTGEPFEYAPWCEGEPNNFYENLERSEDYLERYSGNVWNDAAGYWPQPYVCEIEGDKRIIGIELLQTSFEFEGTPITPEPIVKDGNGNILSKGNDYTLSYENNAGIGTATVIARGINGYTGATSTTFEIKGLDFGNEFWAYVTIMDKTLFNNREENYRVYGKTSIQQTEMNRSLWHFVKVSNGSYAIWSPYDNWVLDMLNYDDYDGATVQMHEYSGGDVTAQCWNVYRMGDGYGIMPMSSRTRSMWFSGSQSSEQAPVQINTTSISSSQTVRLTILNASNSATGYSISANKASVTPGNAVQVTVSDTQFVTDYIFHIIDPDGTETITDNGCNNQFEFIASKAGKYTVYAEVHSPVSTYKGSATNRSVSITSWVSVTSVSLNQTSLKLTEGSTSQLIATVLPANATDGSVNWTSSNTSVASVSSTGKVTALKEGTAIITASSIDGGHSSTCNVTVIKKQNNVKITNQPNNLIGKRNATVTTTVQATGDGLKYQWYFKSNGTTTWKKSGLTGYNTNTLSVQLTDNNASRTYKCIVTDAYNNSAETNVITARIATLSITSEPEDVYALTGQTVSTQVKAASSENRVYYKWQFRTKGTEKWSNSGYVGKDTSVLSIPVNSTSANREFRCVITDDYGNELYTRNVGVFIRTPLAITRQPVNLTGKSGSTVNASFAATGDGLKYQWYFLPAGTTDWKKSGLTGYSTNTLSITVNSTNTTRMFKCIVTDQYGQTVETNPISVKTPVITIVKQPVNIGGQSGSTVKAEVKAEGDGLKFQWQFQTKGTTSWNTSGFVGNNTAILSIPINATNTNRNFRCMITDAYGNTKTTNEISVFISNLKITMQPVNLSGASGDTVKATISATGSGLKYQWYFLTDGTDKWNKSGFTGNTTTTMSIPVNATSVKRQYKCIVTDTYGLSVESDTIRVSLSSIKIIKQPQDIISVIGALEEATIQAQGNGLKYQWYFKTNGTNAWIKSGYIGNATPTLEIPVNTTSINRHFKCVITDATGSSISTNEITVSIGDTPNTWHSGKLY